MNRKKQSRSRILIRAAGGKGVKHDTKLASGNNVVLLDPDIAREFIDSKHVNDTLRAYLELMRVLCRRKQKSK